MKKKTKETIYAALLLATVVFIVLALIMLFLPGIVCKNSYGSASVAVKDLIFGKLKLKTTIKGVTTIEKYSGGHSILGRISFLLVISGFVLLVVRLAKKVKNLELLSGVLFIAAGILMFILNKGCTDIFNGYRTVEFNYFFSDFSLGVGSILSGIFYILAGVCFIGTNLISGVEF